MNYYFILEIHQPCSKMENSKQRIIDLVNDFCHSTDCNEIETILSVSIEHYIKHSGASIEDLANAAYLYNKISSFLLTLRLINDKTNSVEKAIMETLKCSPN